MGTYSVMIRRICNVWLMDKTPLLQDPDLLSKLGLEEITSALGTRRLRWYGHALDQMNLVASREPISMQFRAVEVEGPPQNLV